MKNKIKYMNIALTNRCNLKCVMCDIWKEKSKSDLFIGIINKALEAKCLHEKLDITLTGGEPFLHKELWLLTDALLSKNPRWFKGISTNGTRTKDVAHYLDDFSNRLPSDFTLHISMDGINCHDHQRGRSRDKILNTIHAVREAHPSVKIKIKFTITHVNCTDIIPTFRFCQKNGLDFRAKLAEYAGNYTNRINQRSFTFDDAVKKSIIRDLLKLGKEKYRLRDQNAAFVAEMVRFLKGNVRQGICDVPSQRVFLMSNADVFTCIHFPRIGNLHNNSLDRIWASAIAEKHRNIIKQDGCGGCISYHGARVSL
ncbi:MAG: radical SAM protein [Candidatus Omnitrophica bacterium]|nr:radical SAM protein [Candidatus Omnitrophota bacterium]